MNGKELRTRDEAEVDVFWSDLLDKIEDGRVVPVIGPKLVELDLDGRTGPLEVHLARHLARRLDLVDEFPESSEPALFDVVAAAHRFDREGDYHSMINRLLRDVASAPVPSTLTALARITDFKLYLTLGFDRLLLDALAAERGLDAADLTHLAYAPSKQQVQADLPSPQSALKAPLLYALFGKSCFAPDFVISDEDLLEWVTALQDPDNRPPLLFDALRANHLLFIGCDLPDWLLRFFIRLTRGNRISLSRASETLVGPSQGDHPQLVSFLDRFSPKTLVLDMSPTDFVAELEHRWQQRREGSPTAKAEAPSLLPPDIRPGGVFLSYASQDHAAAARFFHALQDRKIDTWFDAHRLTSGARYAEVIDRNIGRCGVLIPVLSSAALARLKTWGEADGFHPGKKPYFLKEWELALARKQLQPGSLAIMPVHIEDEVDLRDPLLPEGLRSLTCDPAPHGHPDERLLDAVKDSVRKARKQRREGV